MTSELLYDAEDKIVHIQINRSRQMNSIHPPLMAELSGLLRRADEDPGVSVVVLSGVGPNFGAGYDLKYDWSEQYADGPMGMRKMLADCADFEFTPWDCSKPVIAMVRGYCLAGSCELAMMCCITFASETAVFGEPEIRFANAPPAVIMPWIVGLKKARELLYTGDMIDAEEALRIGMVNRVFPDGDLEGETWRYARRAATTRGAPRPSRSRGCRPPKRRSIAARRSRACVRRSTTAWKWAVRSTPRRPRPTRPSTKSAHATACRRRSAGARASSSSGRPSPP